MSTTQHTIAFFFIGNRNIESVMFEGNNYIPQIEIITQPHYYNLITNEEIFPEQAGECYTFRLHHQDGFKMVILPGRELSPNNFCEVDILGASLTTLKGQKESISIEKAKQFIRLNEKSFSDLWSETSSRCEVETCRNSAQKG